MIIIDSTSEPRYNRPGMPTQTQWEHWFNTPELTIVSVMTDEEAKIEGVLFGEGLDVTAKASPFAFVGSQVGNGRQVAMFVTKEFLQYTMAKIQVAGEFPNGLVASAMSLKGVDLDLPYENAMGATGLNAPALLEVPCRTGDMVIDAIAMRANDWGVAYGERKSEGVFTNMINGDCKGCTSMVRIVSPPATMEWNRFGYEHKSFAWAMYVLAIRAAKTG